MKLTIELRARKDKTQELYQTLQALLPTIRREKGCRNCRVSRDVEDGEIFCLTIEWGAQASLEHYVRSRSGSALFGAVDLLSDAARVKTNRDTPWVGIEALKRLRKRT